MLSDADKRRIEAEEVEREAEREVRAREVSRGLHARKLLHYAVLFGGSISVFAAIGYVFWLLGTEHSRGEEKREAAARASIADLLTKPEFSGKFDINKSVLDTLIDYADRELRWERQRGPAGNSEWRSTAGIEQWRKIAFSIGPATAQPFLNYVNETQYVWQSPAVLETSGKRLGQVASRPDARNSAYALVTSTERVIDRMVALAPTQIETELAKPEYADAARLAREIEVMAKEARRAYGFKVDKAPVAPKSPEAKTTEPVIPK